MELRIFNKTKDITFKPYYSRLNTIFAKTLNLLDKDSDYDISVILVRSKFIRKINQEYRGIDKATDVISFAMLDSEEIFLSEEKDLGDVYINIDYVYTQAEEYGHSLEREFCFLFTHGLLHCLGYDHMNKKDEKEMFDLQDKILDDLVSR